MQQGEIEGAGNIHVPVYRIEFIGNHHFNRTGDPHRIIRHYRAVFRKVNNACHHPCLFTVVDGLKGIRSRGNIIKRIQAGDVRRVDIHLEPPAVPERIKARGN